MALAVRRMSANPQHGDGFQVERDLRFEPIFVTFDVEDNHLVRQEARGWIAVFNVLWRLPVTALQVADPVRSPFSATRVVFAEAMQLSKANYSHRQTCSCVADTRGWFPIQ